MPDVEFIDTQDVEFIDTQDVEWIRSEKEYTRGDVAVLPEDDANLETAFTSQDYEDVATDDDVYVQQSATDEYSIFEWKDKNDNSTDGILLHWKGKSDRAPTASAVYLQIYNRNSSPPSWENVDSNNLANADTEFELSGNISANLVDYYDAQHWVSCRVYQEAI